LLMALVSAGSQRDPGKGPQVVHAEMPDCLVAWQARVHGRALIRVTIDKEGKVTGTKVEQPVPIAVRCAEAAARKWTFVPSDRGDARQALLSFLFIGDSLETKEASHQVTSFDDPWSVRLAYARSTVRRLPREDGRIPEKLCPVHGTVMAVGVVSVGYQRHGQGHETYWDAMPTLFPWANRFAPAGDFIQEPEAEVYYCQACRDAEREWLASHPGLCPWSVVPPEAHPE
jgi:TonB family protein